MKEKKSALKNGDRTRISSRIGHLAESGYSSFQNLGSLIPWTLTVRLQSWGRGEGVRSFALGLEQKTCLGVLVSQEL